MSDEENIMSESGEVDAENGVENGENMDLENDPDNPLTEANVSDSLSLLCKTGDGLSHSFVKLELRERELTDIELLKNFIHLRYVDVSKNNLRDISALNALTHMLVLRADNNKLTSAALDELPYLQVASFNNNRITSTTGINHPQLEQISLNYNMIKEVTDLDPERLARLHTLELRGNKLVTTAGIPLPNLKNLFLGGNQIKTVEGLSHFGHLATLHLRENQIDKLDGFDDGLKNLQYVNFRANNISSNKEVKKLQGVPMLRAIVLKENPLSSEDDYRLEMLIALRRIERLDKDEYNDEERQEAETIYEERRQEEAAAAAELASKEHEEMIDGDD